MSGRVFAGERILGYGFVVARVWQAHAGWRLGSFECLSLGGTLPPAPPPCSSFPPAPLKQYPPPCSEELEPEDIVGADPGERVIPASIAVAIAVRLEGTTNHKHDWLEGGACSKRTPTFSPISTRTPTLTPPGGGSDLHHCLRADRRRDDG